MLVPRKARSPGEHVGAEPAGMASGLATFVQCHTGSVIIVTVIMVVALGKIRDPIDDRAGAVHKLFILMLVDGLIVEGSRVQHGLDLGGQRVALGS